MKNKNILSYKKIFFGEREEDVHLEEHESEIVDLEQTIKILECLGIEKILTLHKIRNSFMYKDIFEISLDKVQDLGYFIEIEVKDDTLSISDSNQKLKQLLLDFELDFLIEI